MERETWKEIVGYENYKVSSWGNVERNGNLLKFNTTKKGYKRVLLYGSGKRRKHFVHRLVGVAFVENKDNKPFINHKDLNPSNNYYKNLEWVTQSENEQHSRKWGKTTVGVVLKMDKNSTVLKRYTSAMAAEADGFNFGNICACCRGEKEFYKGYRWSREKHNKKIV